MRFTPKSDKELAEEKLAPEGEYGFEVSGAVDKQSKAGNDMIELTLRIYKPDGNFFLLSDYLMEAMLYKISHACRACGIYEKYESGNLVAEDFIGKTGRLKLGIQKDKTGQYPDRNAVKDYIVPKDGESFTPPKDNLDKTLSKNDDMDDEIPF
jgi:hypothetical protein